jgi:hypothetical protein
MLTHLEVLAALLSMIERNGQLNQMICRMN